MKLLIVEVLCVVAFVCLVFIRPILGLFPFGPEAEVVAVVNRTYVDVSGGKEHAASHYMVATDVGVYEVDNSLWLWLWNADELYGALKNGERYRLLVKGRKLVNFFFQSYPGIISVVKSPEGMEEK